MENTRSGQARENSAITEKPASSGLESIDDNSDYQPDKPQKRIQQRDTDSDSSESGK